MIADQHPVHHSKAVTAWLADNTERIELHLMPGYSPELNPDEILNADIKHHVHAARATSVDDLARETRRNPPPPPTPPRPGLLPRPACPLHPRIGNQTASVHYHSVRWLVRFLGGGVR
ncbi:DDE superfamily endonuclease [Streptomyces yunnanensis]|uniref:DDE superfamily endonuclease n=1 Tax=Streptomyces yunnanensis TaxID=156453 RepID=A0A9X8R0C2_9ACTN|nr:DDE superfamily endonuclease [Streptomyces yunnanensis]